MADRSESLEPADVDLGEETDFFLITVVGIFAVAAWAYATYVDPYIDAYLQTQK